jgi:hypothetical protein
MSADRVLPHDLDAERSVLGAILVDNATAVRARGILDPGDFYRDGHRTIFRSLLALIDAGSAADLVTVTGKLSDAEKIEEVGGAAYVASLVDGVPKASRVEHYAGRVRELAGRRRIATAAEQIQKAALNGHTGEELGELIARLRDAAPRPSAFPSEDLADILARPAPPVPWAVEGILAERDIAIISGAGGIGKSWLALAIALTLAAGVDLFGRFRVTRPYRVAILDLESSPWEVDQRLHRLAAGMGLGPEQLRGRVRIIRQRLRLDVSEDVRRLSASLKTWGSKFLLVDSLRRAFAGDENSSSDVSDLFVSALDPLRSDLSCGVILTDHTRKATGERDLDSADVALRGSTDKRNLCDAHFGIERREERLAFLPTKTRHSRQPEPILLEIAGLSEGAAEDGPVAVRYVGALDRASDRVQDAVVARLEEAGAAGMLRGEIIGRVSSSKRAVAAALAELKRRRRVTSVREGKEARYALSGGPVQRVRTSAERPEATP